LPALRRPLVLVIPMATEVWHLREGDLETTCQEAIPC